MSTFDAALILGGGIRDGGSLPSWVANRFDRAIELDTPVFICLSAGTAHRPLPLTSDGRPIFESLTGARYLSERGVDPQRIFFETSSLDTIGNAYFSKVIHVDPMAIANLVVITSEFHVSRTEKIFRWVYGLDARRQYRLTFDATSNVGLDKNVLDERRKREQMSIQNVDRMAARIQSIKDFHTWLFTEHTLYATALRNEPKEVIAPAIESTY